MSTSIMAQLLSMTPSICMEPNVILWIKISPNLPIFLPFFHRSRPTQGSKSWNQTRVLGKDGHGNKEGNCNSNECGGRQRERWQLRLQLQQQLGSRVAGNKRSMARVARAMATVTKRAMATSCDNTDNGNGKEGDGFWRQQCWGWREEHSCSRYHWREEDDDGNGP